MKTKTLLFSVLIVFIIHNTNAQKNKGKKDLNQTVSLQLDNIAFNDNEYMKILDSEDNIIAYYDRFDNKSGPVKSVNLMNLKKELVYVLVPVFTDNGYTIHIKNKDGVRGLVDITGNISGFKIAFKSQVAYFEMPYNYEFSVKAGIGKARSIHCVTHKDQEVLSYETKVSAFSKIKINPFIADKTCFENHTLDVANWMMIIQLFKELSIEASRYNTNMQLN